MNKILGAFAIVVAASMWALEGVVLTPQLYNLDVSFVVFIIHIVTFLILTPFLWKRFATLKEFTKEDSIYMGLIALFGGALGTLAIVKALFLVNFEHLSVVVLLQKLQPIFAIILATTLLKEKPKKEFYLWAGLALVASYFLAFGLSLPKIGENSSLAIFYAIFAAFAFGSSTVFGRKLAKKYNYKTLAYYRAGFTSIIMLFIIVLLGKTSGFIVATNMNWIIITTVALLSGVVSMLLYYYGMMRVKASIATICELFFPVSAVVLDYFVNGNVFSAVQWISAGVMVLAISQVSQTKA